MCRHCWREEMGYDSDWDSAMDMYDDPEMDEDMQRGMNHLPNEILDQICQLLSPNDLKSLRLVCSRPVITANLFSYCHLEPTTASYKAVTKLSQNPQLKQLVRKVIYSLTNSTDIDTWEKYKGQRDRRYWKAVGKGEDLEAFFGFPKADSLEIRFQDFRPYEAAWWRGEDDDDESLEEDENTLFSAVNFGNYWLGRLLPPARRLIKPMHNLTIVNLPNHPMHITHDKKFKFNKMMKALRELHLSVDTMASSQRQFLGPKLSLLGHYVDCWLKPTTNNLTSLSLHMKSYWGPFYGLSFQALEFAKLRHLTLWNFAFLYEVQLEWILKHKGLETLNLIGCPIVVHMEVDHPVDCEHCGLLRRNDYTGEVSTTDMGWFVWRNNIRWAPWLSRIKNEMKKLTTFSMAGGHQYELESGWKEKGSKSYAEWPEDDIFPDYDEDEMDVEDDDHGNDDDVPELVSDYKPKTEKVESSTAPSAAQAVEQSEKIENSNKTDKAQQTQKDEDNASVDSFDEANEFFAEEWDEHDELYENTFEEDWFWADNDINHHLETQFENTDKLPKAAKFVDRDNFPAWLHRYRYVALRMDSITDIWSWSNWNSPTKWWGLVRNMKFNYEEQKEEQKALRDLMVVVRRRKAEA